MSATTSIGRTKRTSAKLRQVAPSASPAPAPPSVKAPKRIWSNKEKEALLASLKIYGSADTKKVSEAVGKPEESIKTIVRKMKRSQQAVPMQRTPDAIVDPAAAVGAPSTSTSDQPAEPRAPIEHWIRMLDGEGEHNVLPREAVTKNINTGE